MKYKIYLLLFLLPFFSCQKPPPTRVSLDIKVFESFGDNKKYPDNLIEIGKPLKRICNQKSTIIFYPLQITRPDQVAADVSVNYLFNKATNYEKIKAVERDYSKYFSETPPPAAFNAPLSGIVLGGVLQNLPPNSYFILTKQNADGKISFDNVQELRAAITKKICEEPAIKKITVLYYPPTDPEFVHTDTVPTPSDPSVDSPKSVPSTELGFSPDLIRVKLLKVARYDAPYDRVKLAKEVVKEFFSDDVKVLKYEAGISTPRVWETGDGKKYFLNRLATLSSIINISVQIDAVNKTDHKISQVSITETHNKSIN